MGLKLVIRLKLVIGLELMIGLKLVDQLCSPAVVPAEGVELVIQMRFEFELKIVLVM